ncbi:dihydroxyacetone kinase [Verruconis gallopava]|uniref:Dihydroxyacetone kinase n=1 Tax=Verruconis gallopava TaxID=253628 RepID=A0A0D2AA22_9PEZI|nr:dihydroxyacetone kinase [Verruconis gallopava]KIW03430.1 dihydroxyacetone kinase [Verruconis gallopava]
MSTKHFISDPSHLVNTALHAVTLTNPSLSIDLPNKIIYRTNASPSNVSLISGGGSGHEPSFASFVGNGLLTSAVAGTIFASPSAVQIRNAIMGRVPTQKGVLVIVMNYTGDVLNFGMGVEKARAHGVPVEMVVVGDDVGVTRSAAGKVGRRGIAGTCLVHKVTGALAEQGASLDDCVKIAKLVSGNLVSVGASLSHVHVPGRDKVSAEEELEEEEIEVGMGIHNEAGSERVKTDLVGLVKKMLAQLLDQTDKERAFLNIPKGAKVVLLVNNLGGVSVLEMGGIVDEVVRQLQDTWGLEPVRTLLGTFMTSLNGMGFSISLLQLQDTGLGAGKSMLELLDAPSEATGWSAAIKTSTWDRVKPAIKTEEIKPVDEEEKPGNLKFDYAYARTALETALKRLIAAEPDITNYDTIVGDGDCGIGLKRGAEGLLKMLERSKSTDDVLIFLQRVIKVVESTMDGTSGAIYAIFLNALAAGVRSQSPTSTSAAAEVREPMQVGIWARALETALQSLGKYTPAQPGDRTLVDALDPFVSTLSRTGSVQKAAEAAQEGAKKTKDMKASLGRTVYVGGEGFKTVPDPGAYGLAEFLMGLNEGLK